MRRLLIACSVLLLTGAGCDAVGQPDWAARVDGDEISMEDVQALLNVIDAPPPDPSADPAATTSTTAPFQLTGSTTREALSYLIRWDLIERWLDQLDVPVSPEARQQAEQQVGQLDAPEATRDRIIAGLAAEGTLPGALIEHADDPAYASLVDDFYESREGTWEDWVCLEGLAVPAADRAAVDAAVAAPGATLEGVVAAQLPNVQALFPTGVQGCFPEAQLPEDLAQRLAETPDGDLAVVEQENQQVGTVVFYMRELGRKDIARDDADVLTAFASELQGQGGQEIINLVIGATARDAEIEILSTIGTGFDDRTLLVTPPVTPLGVTTTTLPLLGG